MRLSSAQFHNRQPAGLQFPANPPVANVMPVIHHATGGPVRTPRPRSCHATVPAFDFSETGPAPALAAAITKKIKAPARVPADYAPPIEKINGRNCRAKACHQNQKSRVSYGRGTPHSP